jgi:HTH-type transcriptional regulator, quorum sensing regulator NprR
VWTLHVGHRLKYIRASKGLSLSKMGIGIVSSTHLSNIENGRYKPSDEMLIALAEKLDMKVQYFLNHEKFDSNIQSLLEKLLDNLILQSSDLDEIIKRISNFKISNVQQEAMYLMLLAIYKLKKNTSPEVEICQLEYYEITNDDLKDNFCRKVYYYFQGQLLYSKKKYSESLNHFRKLSLENHQSSEVFGALMYNLSLLEYRAKFYIRATRSAEKALSVSLKSHNWNNCFDIYNLLMVIAWKSKDLELAFEYSKLALNIGNSSVVSELHRYFHNEGLILLEAGDPTKAIKSFQKSISLKLGSNMPTFNSSVQILKCHLIMKDSEGFNSQIKICEELAESEKEKILLKYLKLKSLEEREGEVYLESIQELVGPLKENGLIKEFVSSTKDLAIKYSKLNLYKQAFTYYHEIIRIWEREYN